MKVIIPDKLYFKIGEVSEIVGVKPYVLRFWETEFKDIEPVKSRTGQRLYKRQDVEELLRIKELLYQERFTIDGARQKLREERGASSSTEEQLGFELPVIEGLDASSRENILSLLHEIKKEMSHFIKEV